VASFSNDDATFQRLDWRLLQNGFVTRYSRRETLAEDAAWLRAHVYDVKELDSASWADVPAMHQAFASTFAFPDDYGKNLDALNDCISDVEVSDDSGLAIVLTRFDAFAARERDVARAVIDILADNARRFMLFGRRVIVLVESNEAEFHMSWSTRPR